METDPMKRAAVALALALLPGAAGCDAATNAANGAGALVDKAALSIEQKTNDAAITLAVKGALADADGVLARQVKVGTYNSIVSLSGTVPTPELKARAEQIALEARGVVRVLNALDVGPLQ
jgi:hyperosmotically inducible protein